MANARGRKSDTLRIAGRDDVVRAAEGFSAILNLRPLVRLISRPGRMRGDEPSSGAERLVGSAVVVEGDPVSDFTACMRHALAALPVEAPYLQLADQPIHQGVLPRPGRSDDLRLRPSPRTGFRPPLQQC